MIVAKSRTCIACGIKFSGTENYGNYYCRSCNKPIGSLCPDCKKNYKCGCGGEPYDKTAEWAAQNGVSY